MKDTVFGVTIAIILLLLCLGTFMYIYKKTGVVSPDTAHNLPIVHEEMPIVAA